MESLYRLLLAIFLMGQGTVAMANCSEAAKLVHQGAKLSDGSGKEESLYREAIKLCPGLGSAHFNLALNLKRQGQLESALASLDAIKEDIEGVNVNLARAGTLVGLRRYGEAITAYQGILASDTENIQALQGLSVAYLERGEVSQAEDVLRRAIQHQPDDAVLFYNLGLVLFKTGRVEEALTSFDTALRNDSQLVSASKGKINALIALKRIGEARTLAEELSTKHPNQADLWGLLAVTQERDGRLEAALDAARTAHRLDPRNARHQVDLGVLLLRFGDEDGLAQIKRAVEISPDSSYAQGALGWALLQQRKPEARQHLERAVALDDSNAQAHYNLAVLLENSGFEDEAAPHFTRANDLDPGLIQSIGRRGRGETGWFLFFK